jgi:hypothetical protein
VNSYKESVNLSVVRRNPHLKKKTYGKRKPGEELGNQGKIRKGFEKLSFLEKAID